MFLGCLDDEGLWDNERMFSRVNQDLSVSALHHNLYRVLVIRGIVLLLQWGAWCWAILGNFEIDTLNQVFWVLLIFTTITLLSLSRVIMRKPLTEVEFFSQLLVDVVALTVLLYFSGGSTNPFVSYYLIPVIIAAASLPWRYTLMVAASSLVAYSLLLFYYHPLGILAPSETEGHLHHSTGINLHVLGMWGNFVVSTLLVTYFVVKMAGALRQREQELQSLREDDLRNEQILGVATLAAGTAHELGTPLSTMKVIASELLDDNDGDDYQRDMKLLLLQIEKCQHTLQSLVRTASVDQVVPVLVNEYLQRLFDGWCLLRPDINVENNVTKNCPSLWITPPKTLEQSIINLLDNAADASPNQLELNVFWDSESLLVSIRDYGEGIPESMINELGEVFVTSKSEGLGIGLLLTHATITHYGGSVRLFRQPVGTLTEISLPLQNFLVEPPLV